MRITLDDMQLGASRRFDLDAWPHLPRFQFDFPRPVRCGGIIIAAPNSRPPYLIIQLFCDGIPEPGASPDGMLVIYNNGSVAVPSYSHDLDHWHQPSGAFLRQYDKLARARVRPAPCGPYAQYVGAKAWMMDDVLEIRDRSDGIIEHADDECVWIRCWGVLENLLQIHPLDWIRGVRDIRR